MTLGDFIKEYRTTHNLSMDAFSDRSGISKAYISLLEKNKHPKTGKPIAPSLQCIKQAAEGMNIDFNELFSKLDGNVILNENDSAYKTSSSISQPDYVIEVNGRQLIIQTDSISTEDEIERFEKYISIASKLNSKQLDVIYGMIDQMAPGTPSVSNNEIPFPIEDMGPLERAILKPNKQKKEAGNPTSSGN